MWEAIAANKFRSRILLFVMAVLLLAAGAALGMYFQGEMLREGFSPDAGPWGLGSLPYGGAALGAAAALLLWFVLALTALWGGDAILLGSVGARKVLSGEAPQLLNVVQEMSLAAGLKTVPDVYILDDSSLNAFAVGRTPEKAAVAVTSGLLRQLSRDELQGVIGHEIGHIVNLDIRFMTMASVMVGAITLLSDVFFRSLRYGGGRRSSRSDNDRGGGGSQAQLILLLITLAVMILAPLTAQILYFACSRKREYLADASSARFTRFPAGLASALRKIAMGPPLPAPRAAAPLFIVNPLSAAGGDGIFSTHPSIDKRIAVLEAMGGQAGFDAYDRAFSSVAGGGAGVLGDGTLAGAQPVAAREAAPEPEPSGGAREFVETLRSGGVSDAELGNIARAQQVTDLLARMGDYLILSCACGMKIKLPPGFRGDSLVCPRCGAECRVPAAQLDLAQSALPGGAQGASAPASDAPLVYHRQQDHAWESFKCSCGQTQQISPSFQGSFLACRRCGRQISIEPALEGARLGG